MWMFSESSPEWHLALSRQQSVRDRVRNAPSAAEYPARVESASRYVTKWIVQPRSVGGDAVIAWSPLFAGWKDAHISHQYSSWEWGSATPAPGSQAVLQDAPPPFRWSLPHNHMSLRMPVPLNPRPVHWLGMIPTDFQPVGNSETQL